MRVTHRRQRESGRARQQRMLYEMPELGVDMFRQGDVTLCSGDALDWYAKWPAPTCIVSDGAYGLALFPGDPRRAEDLVAWYEPHVARWADLSTPQTTLWFWNSEVGWATVHGLLAHHGWRYVACHVWDKGIGHAAGNSNTKTLRKFPVVTEVCVQYFREARVGGLTLQEWLRSEWSRTGLAMALANEAAGVRNAATRKYLTADHLWYFPPPEEFARMVAYANSHGEPGGRPYFSLDGERPCTQTEWAKMRAKFHCKPAVTNVWKHPALNGAERIRLAGKSVHMNQKPLRLMELLIEASTDVADVVWEPFGGLCSAAIAAYRARRQCYSAEVDATFYELAVRRLANEI